MANSRVSVKDCNLLTSPCIFDTSYTTSMHERRRYSRREAIALLGTAGVLAASDVTTQAQPPAPGSPIDAAVERNDAAVRRLLETQITDPSSAWRGSVPDRDGLHSAGSAAGVAETLAASFVHPQSRFHDDDVVMERIRLAAGFLERAQSPQGNVDLLTTNFNSPPDTGFVVHLVATAAAIGRMHGKPVIADALRAFLVKAAGGMASGGVHTPNHRWVVSSALAQVNELFPDARYVRRIDEWLAEGIDIDADGQYTERSTLTYNVVTDRALVVMAAKLKRPDLLEPVRRNLRALTYLLHADGEVVTEISRRQDQYTRGGVSGYWFPLTYLAAMDQDGQFAALARRAADGARLSALLEYPELSKPLPVSLPLPEDFEKSLPAIGITRIRRGPLSATLILGGSSRLFTLRQGDAVVEGVRFATAFFGKGQFIPDTAGKRGDRYLFRQALEAPYYQPLARQVDAGSWTATRAERRQTEIARLEQSAEITEVKNGFRFRARAEGTAGVPLAIEICFREGGQLEGCREVPASPGSWLLERGMGVYRAGRSQIRFGPGTAPHQYVQVRGAEPRLPGQSVYLTGYTPFDQTLMFECS
jgi:hypothetical protein